MKTMAAVAACLCAHATMSHAEELDLRGTGEPASSSAVRNVLAPLLELSDCEQAIWPNIPTGCLKQAEARQKEEKAPEVASPPAAFVSQEIDPPQPLLPSPTEERRGERVIVQITPSIIAVRSD